MKYLIALAMLTLAACGSAKATGTGSSEIVNAPVGYGHSHVCFLIRDEEGKAVGGTCIAR